MLNTPPTYSVYISGLCFKYYLKIGGLEAVERQKQDKAQLLFDTITNSGGYYEFIVPDIRYRSLINVTFRCFAGDHQHVTENKDKMTPFEIRLIECAKKEKLKNLKGHVTNGGIRASLYNAMPIEGVRALCQFLVKFQHDNPLTQEGPK